MMITNNRNLAQYFAVWFFYTRLGETVEYFLGQNIYWNSWSLHLMKKLLLSHYFREKSSKGLIFWPMFSRHGSLFVFVLFLLFSYRKSRKPTKSIRSIGRNSKDQWSAVITFINCTPIIIDRELLILVISN